MFILNMTKVSNHEVRVYIVTAESGVPFLFLFEGPYDVREGQRSHTHLLVKPSVCKEG